MHHFRDMGCPAKWRPPGPLMPQEASSLKIFFVLFANMV